MTIVDLTSDWHTHSSLTDGAHPPEQMLAAAAAAGLSSWGLSDHVRATSDWVGDYVKTMAGLRHSDVDVRVGVEVKILDHTGRLDLPPGLPALDYILVADHQFPGPDGPVTPPEVAARLDRAQWHSSDVIATLVAATVRALAQAPAPPIVAHLFSLLPKCGLDEDEVPDALVRELADGCNAVSAQVEINEKWRCPSPRVVRLLHESAVRLRAGTDAHRDVDVGHWSYVPDTIAALL